MPGIRSQSARAPKPIPAASRRRAPFFVSLSKFLNAKTIYAGNSPMVGKFGEAFYKALQAFFQDEKELLLTVEQYQIKWRGETVYDNRERNESIAFLFYKDGVGEIIIQAAAKNDELEQFVDLIKNEISCTSSQGDIVSKLWQSEFANISYRVFDECADGKVRRGTRLRKRVRGTAAPRRRSCERVGRESRRPGQFGASRPIARIARETPPHPRRSRPSGRACLRERAVPSAAAGIPLHGARGGAGVLAVWIRRPQREEQAAVASRAQCSTSPGRTTRRPWPATSSK